MSSLNNIKVDLSKLSVSQREMLGKIAFADKEASLTPFLLLCVYPFPISSRTTHCPYTGRRHPLQGC
jgi:hypothetical protein